LLSLVQRHAGVSQARLATATGIGQGRLNEIINGHRQVARLDVLERIAGGLAMPDDARVLFGLAPVHADTLTGHAEISKPEHETKVADAAVVDEILRALGLEHLVAFEKHCANYRFTAQGRDMLATVVTVPEIDGTFVELETLTDQDDLAAALGDVRAVLGELGIGEDDLTTEQYTDAVMRARA
jgi:adenylate cyclase class 2